MAATIEAVQAGSPAARAGLRAGDVLEQINGRAINDVLDFQYHSSAPSLKIDCLRAGKPLRIELQKGEYEPLGLDFKSYLMDDPRRCHNRCVFCFIDQNPEGMRETIYFKDDDTRLSFLTGNYVTLTNVSEADIDRIIEQRIMPINVSVHATELGLRRTLLGNPKARDVMPMLTRLAEAGIQLNGQIVLCPELNDGAALDRTLADLCALAPAMCSISVVPVGLTKHRKGLYPLRALSAGEAADTIDCIGKWAALCKEQHGSRICYPSDELYLLAGRDIPAAEAYEDFPQLDNGVGMLALCMEEFFEALEEEEKPGRPTRASVATGLAAEPFIRAMVDAACKKWDNLHIEVYGVENRFYGRDVTVAGLLVGRDLAGALKEKPLHGRLLIPCAMLRAGEEVFLDDMSLAQLSETLGVPITVIEGHGAGLLDAILAE